MCKIINYILLLLHFIWSRILPLSLASARKALFHNFYKQLSENVRSRKIIKNFPCLKEVAKQAECNVGGTSSVHKRFPWKYWQEMFSENIYSVNAKSRRSRASSAATDVAGCREGKKFLHEAIIVGEESTTFPLCYRKNIHHDKQIFERHKKTGGETRKTKEKTLNHKIHFNC